MKQFIFSDFRKYNANSRNANVGDCVNRSLSLAYGLNYDDVNQELNRIKRNMGYSSYKIFPVYHKFIESHGCEMEGSPTYFNLPKDITVSEFCDKFPSGIYLLLVNDKRHLVCILDGDFWDSWDCSNKGINYIYTISTNGDPKIYETTAADIYEEIFNYIQDYVASYNKKMPYAHFEFGDPVEVDKYGISQEIRCTFDESLFSQLPEYRYYWVNCIYAIKVNPRQSLEDNISKQKSKLKTKIREWMCSIKKEVNDDIAAKSLHTNRVFHGSKTLLLKLPVWCRSMVTELYDSGPNPDGAWYRYEMTMEALPDDPRFDTDPIVDFRADTIPQLKSDIESYKEDFSRYGYDY